MKRFTHDADLRGMVVLRSLGFQLVPFKLHRFRKQRHFYSKTGFAPISEDVIKAPLKLSYPEGWIAQPLSGDSIEPIDGKPNCLQAIDSPDYW
ncbi:hypothetical protein [Aeromonas salmonicida]|uniref:hypothetical protein n=1 Tax=Aeromonas salmonicida TaxID=645 RepID=UPI0012D94AC1|nr:hypothetical protein [Aeromonas salmonicida]